MTDNDYLAEYVREKKPELVSSMDFFNWKIARMVRNMCEELAKAFKKALNDEDLTINDEDVSKVDLPVLDDQSYHEYIKEQGKKYCKKHCGSMDNLCGNCPLRENMYCINQEGCLIVNEDSADYISAMSQYNYMIEEVNKVD